MVVLSDSIKALQNIKQNLLDEQKKLIELLKHKNAELYAWVVDNKVDLTNLKPFAANIAAAFVIGMTVSFGSRSPSPQIDPIEPFAPLETNDLKGLDEVEKAEKVWSSYGKVIETVADKYNLDPKVIFATVMIESGGDRYAIRPEPAIGDASYGLGQILFGTARGLGFDGTPKDLFDPKVNIELIGIYHRRNLNVYGENLTLEQLVTAYNAGSPYSYPTYGHLQKFDKWLDIVGRISS
ncbi:MAG: transglycosylase SLT domain-containing protein [Patescibacteria group bacterium]